MTECVLGRAVLLPDVQDADRGVVAGRTASV
jgi:hypothetical protein